MSEPTGTQAPAPDGGQSGRPTPGERGLGGASAPPGRTDSPPAHQAPATGPRNSGCWAEGLSDYLNSGERPSHKVVLSYILGAGRTGDLAGFARALIERPHPELGNHLNFTFIVLQADGGKEMARLVAKLFEKQGVLIVAIPHALGGPGVPGAEVAQSVGLSGVITAEGRTLVMIGEEPFFVAGTPPPPRTRSSSVLFIYKARQTKKMYRLDYGLIPKGPSAGQTGWHHNQKGVLKILKLEGTDHTPASGWATI